MANPSLLPGVSGDRVPPPIRCNARSEIRRARRSALFRDGFQLALLLSVDMLFLTWPGSHFPLLGREASLDLLRMVNLLAVAALVISRAFPRWSARRVANTWCRREQMRFTRAR